MKTTTSTRAHLQKAIDKVNSRYARGLNDDDAVRIMVEISENCKGFTFQPLWDTYEITTDEARLFFLVDKYGYWSEEVKTFNATLIKKGGYEYMQELNVPHTGTQNVK